MAPARDRISVSELYPHWELCIADDASSNPHVRRVLDEYETRDKRIKVVRREMRGHISAASNSALEIAEGDFVALLDHDDELREHSLYMLAAELNAHPDAGLIYSDEDKIDQEGTRYGPYFKPDWNPTLFLAQNFVCHLVALRAALVRETGGFSSGYEGAQDWDLVYARHRANPCGVYPAYSSCSLPLEGDPWIYCGCRKRKKVRARRPA